jgi:hypothetical protein
MVTSPSLQNEIDFIEVAYAGSSPLIGVNVKSNLVLYGNSSTPSQVKLTNSTFTNGAGYGLYAENGAVLVTFANNAASNNAGTAAFVYADQLGKLDAASKFNSGNGYNGVQTEGETESEVDEVTWPSFTDGSKYLVTKDLTIQSGVVIAPGATFEFGSEIGMYVRAGGGYLIAKVRPVRKSPSPAKTRPKASGRASWLPRPAVRNEFEYTEVAYAGAKPLIGVSTLANLVLYGNSSTPANAKITNSTFAHGNGFGLYVERGANVNADAATANTYSNNTGGGFSR